MKKISQLIILILTVGITASGFSQASMESLTGSWQFVSKSGGMTGKTIYANPEHEPKILQFTSDSIYREFNGDSLIVERKYHLTKSKSIYRKGSVQLITIDKKLIKQSFSIFGNRLVLKDECYDCYGHIYKRVKPIINTKVSEKCKF